MLDPIRLATPEEIEAISKESDLTAGSTILAFPGGREQNIYAVIRTVTELDPVIFNDATDQRKMIFMWGVENMLRSMGLPEYYFNVHMSNEKQIAIVEKMGAEAISTAPEFRFKKVLNVNQERNNQ